MGLSWGFGFYGYGESGKGKLYSERGNTIINYCTCVQCEKALDCCLDSIKGQTYYMYLEVEVIYE